MTARPSAADVAAYLDIDPATPGIEVCLSAALEQQESVCDTSRYTDSLALAAIRRTARAMAARSAPGGFVQLGDFGSAPLPRWDAEIERYEADYRHGGFA